MLRDLTLPALISLGGALVSYGAMTARVSYAERMAQQAVERSGGVDVLDERTRNIEITLSEIKGDVKVLLGKVK